MIDPLDPSLVRQQLQSPETPYEVGDLAGGAIPPVVTPGAPPAGKLPMHQFEEYALSLGVGAFATFTADEIPDCWHVVVDTAANTAAKIHPGGMVSGKGRLLRPGGYWRGPARGNHQLTIENTGSVTLVGHLYALDATTAATFEHVIGNS